MLAGIQSGFNASPHFENLTEEALTRASDVIEGRASFSSLASWYKGQVDGMRKADFTSQRLESFHEDVLRNGPNMASAIAAVKDFDTTPQVDAATPSPPPRDHAEAQGGEPQEKATRAAIRKTDTMPYNETTSQLRSPQFCQSKPHRADFRITTVGPENYFDSSVTGKSAPCFMGGGLA